MRGDLKGVHAIVPPGIYIGAGFDQIMYDVQILLRHGFHENRVKRGIGGVDVGTGFHQQMDDRHALSLDGAEEGDLTVDGRGKL